MSEFLFQKSQRVTLPAKIAGTEGVQGVVTGYSVDIGREPSYTVQWPTTEYVHDNGAIRTISAFVNESDLLAAQPPKMVTEEAALALAKKSLDDGRAAAFAEIEAEREARRRKRKPAGKTKPKSKRNR